MPARVLATMVREGGVRGCARKLVAATRAGLPPLIRRRRTAPGVAAYFDLITDDGRLFYGDSFHLGYFRGGGETLAQALDAHTDLVAEMARLGKGQKVLDVGCGIGAPALRISERWGCDITAVNFSREQVRQGRDLVEASKMSSRVTITRGDARSLQFADASFDAVVCLEAAGDICVAEEDKDRLVCELRRVLRPGGHVGFSDLALRSRPARRDDRVFRSVLYHSATELVTDWAKLFARNGFTIVDARDIIAETMPTWDRVRRVYEERAAELARRYGKRMAARIRAQVERIPEILRAHATFPVLSARR